MGAALWPWQVNNGLAAVVGITACSMPLRSGVDCVCMHMLLMGLDFLPIPKRDSETEILNIGVAKPVCMGGMLF